MRKVLLVGVMVCALIALAPQSSYAATASAPMAGAAPAAQLQDIDDHDDTRVEVQLVVLAIAFVTVFVVGTGAYMLRKRLGLVPPAPEQDAGGHH